MRHERLVNSGSYTGSTVSYNSNNKWDQERAERERQEREADQRAKARYDARTCLLYTSKGATENPVIPSSE